MGRETEWQKANAKNYIWSYCGERIILRGRDILYAHIEQRKVYVHTRNMIYRVGGTLKETQERLEGLPVIRTHAAYLVHMDHLQRINRSMAVLKNGEQIPVSKNCWKQVKQSVEEYFGQRRDENESA